MHWPRGLRGSLEQQIIGWDLPPLARAFAEVPIEADSPHSWCPRCGESIGNGELTRRGCASCRGSRVPWNAFVRLGEYRTALARRVLQVKHMRWDAMGEALGQRLGMQVRLSVDEAFLRRKGLVVPVPMPWLRRLWRGSDHAESVAIGVARELGWRLVRSGSQRLGPTQTSRSRSERKRARRRFALSAGDIRRVKGRAVLVVDDVRTTGSTLKQFARLLRDAGAADIVAAALAVVPNPRRRHWSSRAVDEAGTASGQLGGQGP